MTNTKRSVVCILFALTMILAIFPLNVFANDEDILTASTDNVVTISSLSELEGFRDAVNSGNTYEGYTVSLTASIELSDEWSPIGNGIRDGKTYTGNAFKGAFNGNGNTIKGLTVTSAESSAAVGLFGVVDGGTVQNLVFEDVAINTASKNAGSAIGLMVGGATADNITVNSGSVVAADGAGGIVGRMTVSGTISNCSNSASVEATSAGGAGGIVGKAYYTETDKLMTISDCTNTATVKSGYAAGGIVALCAADVKNCSNSGAVSASTEAGGIVGEQVNRGIVSGNTNTADVVGEATAAGGIVGWVRYQTSTDDYELSELVQVIGNKNSGSVSKGEGDGSLGYGGIVGTVYNQALVSGNENTAPSITGGTFAAGILGGAQIATNNLIIDGETITTSNNVSATPLANIVGICVAADAYNNDASFVASDNLTGVSGEGTEEAPYLISSPAEFKWFRDNVNAGNTYEGLYVELTADIDLANEEWTPIGSYSTPFKGYFNGGDHTVSNLKITAASTYVGLFGYVKGTAMNNTVTPSVQNLKLTSIDVSCGDSSSRVGGLVGNPYVCYIKNVHVAGTVSGGKWTGGLVGNCYARIDDCSFEGSVTSNNQAGGIAGAGDARVYNCKVIGDVTAAWWAGGIIGNGQEGASAVGCYVKGDITVDGNWYRGVGGIAGVAGHGYEGSAFENNYFDGNVYLAGEKVPAVVVGIVNVSSNEDINTVVSGNSWNTEYYDANTVVYVVGELDSDATTDEWIAGAAEELTTTRNNNLIMHESDIQYVDATSLDDVTVMTFSDVEIDDEALSARVGMNAAGIVLKLEDGILYVSYDKEATWVALGKVHGSDGKDGLGIEKAEINDNGELVITYTDGTSANLGVIEGKDGANGADGKDGMDGANGVDGNDGIDGNDGKDANQVLLYACMAVSALCVIITLVAISKRKNRSIYWWVR